jgi:hypothetical protein
MITAWQTSLDEQLAPELLVRFGRVRKSLSVAIIEDDQGLRVEARVGRRLVERVRVGHDRERLASAVESAVRAAVAEILV